LTLTEVLLDAGADPASNGNALWVAVRAKRIDIVRLLLDRRVPVNAVDFESACYSCDPELIQLFVDRGADQITGYPLYRSFQAQVHRR
jgi:ankyrin repeat protein